MSAVTASLCFTLLMFDGVFMFVSADQKTITAESGQDVTLTCRAPNNNIRVVKWSRADLVDEYVLWYQNDHFASSNQHPSFMNRVDLQDRQMKDGDVSLILKDVTINDAGTYECHVFIAGTDSWKLISSILLIVVDPPDKKNIKAEVGQDVNLTCRAPNNNIKGVEWIRPDLKPDQIFLYRDERFELANQHPSFKNRVDLQDRQMKDGDVSLILKNVMNNDAGRYECHVVMGGSNRRKRAGNTEHITIIYLSVVDPPGQTGGSVGLIVGLIVSAVLLVAAVVGFLIYRKREKTKSRDPYQPPA